MHDALERIAAIASTLKEAELRTLLELTRRADGRNQVRYSSLKNAEAAGLSRKNVQLALDSLSNWGLISGDGGSATRATTYQLAYTMTAVLPGPGVIATPPHHQETLFRRHPGAETTPPAGVIATPPINRERARASATEFPSSFQNHDDVTNSTSGKRNEISLQSMRVLDAVLTANPKKADPELLARARDRLYGYIRNSAKAWSRTLRTSRSSRSSQRSHHGRNWTEYSKSSGDAGSRPAALTPGSSEWR